MRPFKEALSAVLSELGLRIEPNLSGAEDVVCLPILRGPKAPRVYPRAMPTGEILRIPSTRRWKVQDHK